MRRVLAVVTLALLTSGCGYRPAGRGELYREDVQTVSIPIVGNRTFSRSDSAQLTNALVRQIEERTPYRVASQTRADTILEVTITDIRRSTGARNRGTGLPEQQLYIVTSTVSWKDLRSGEVLLRRENFEQTAVLYPTLGETDFIASQDAAERLAKGIVEELAGDW